MKNKKIFLLACLLMAFSITVFTACVKDEKPTDTEQTDDNTEENNNNDTIAITMPIPTPEDLRQVRNEALEEITQTVKFDAKNGINFTSEKGAKLNIYGNSMYLNNNLVTDSVTLQFVELYDRGNMLAVNKALMGADANGNKGPMITGGQFYISITKDGEQLDAYYNMQIPAVNSGGLNSTMTLWTAEENENGDLLWEEANPKQDSAGGVWGEGLYYSVFGGSFGWINIDILYSLPDPKTQIWISVPEGYDQKNCSVYVVYKDQPGALAYMDVWNDEKKMFTEHYGLAPIGFNFFVVFVSAQEDGQYVYAYKDVVVEENKVITFEAADLQTKDKDSLIELINNL